MVHTGAEMADDDYFMSADEFQARLALRSLWSQNCARGKLVKNGSLTANSDEAAKDITSEEDEEDDERAACTSGLHRAFRSEVDQVLKTGLTRRMERMQKQLKQAAQAGGREHTIHEHSTNGVVNADGKKNGVAHSSPGAASQPSAQIRKSLNAALLAAAKATIKPELEFGASHNQRKLISRLGEPPEKNEEIIKEATTLKLTLKSVSQCCSNRARQIENLTSQLEKCHELYEERVGLAQEAAVNLQRLQENPSSLQEVHSERVRRRKKRVEEMADAVRNAQAEAAYYQDLVQQQQHFLESGRAYLQRSFQENGGTYLQQLARASLEQHAYYQTSLAHHPAGEVFLVPRQPHALGEDKVERWDVGCSIANPYVCDSWPFEPNVLARRSPQEVPMQPLLEETEEDIEEENRGFRHLFRSGLNLRSALGPDDDDDDDRMPGTSRSA